MALLLSLCVCRLFGEEGVLTGAPRNAYVRAEGTMQLYVLGQGDLTKVLEAYPAVDQILRKAMAKRQQEKEEGEETLSSSFPYIRPRTSITAPIPFPIKFPSITAVRF